jgi:DNA-binding transcriptional LysR family regulator
MTTAIRPLALDAVQAFVLVVDLSSFTRASEVLETSQAAISLKLKRLEERLGCRLLERTPRHIRLLPSGERFIAVARELLIAHERAIHELTAPAPRRFILGISDHVAGPDLPNLLSRLAADDPSLVIEVRIGPSRDLLAAFDHAELDAAIVLAERDRRDGERLVEEPFFWFAAPTYRQRPGEPLRLASVATPCGVRATAIRILEEAQVPFVEVFVGGGAMAVSAAVSAGLAVAALGVRLAPAATIDVGAKLGLPRLPKSHIVLHARLSDARSREALRVIGLAFRRPAAEKRSPIWRRR